MKENGGGHHGHHMSKASLAGLLVALGIIYGDIGTSPLYVMKAIIGDAPISERLVLGGLSCVFWTLTLQTTIKYVMLTLQADNNGEGGIFSLYALVRKRFPSLIFPAMIGGAALLADGVITPSISVSSAIEGLLILNPNIDTLPIVMVIIVLLFIVQQFGTGAIGKAFGPIMLVWFGMLMALGFSQLINDFSVLRAINPLYAVDMLTQEPAGFWILGAVFLCTTGAEALYSDLGHCGRANIRYSWSFVKAALLVNYFGQGAFLLGRVGQPLSGTNPFYGVMPDWFLVPGIIISTLATVIASQALISGSFTLVSEAIRLDIWPKLRVQFPTIQKGQLYVPSINWLLMFGCLGVLLYFRESSHMEAAYGLSITIAMLMTTVLLVFYLHQKRFSLGLLGLMLLVYLAIELSFFTANIVKFTHGAWVTVLISSILLMVMYVSYRSRRIKNRLYEYTPLHDHLPKLIALSRDTTVPKFATNLIYLTGAPDPSVIDKKIIYSILQKKPKRADLYWFIHVTVTDDPHTMEYKVSRLDPNADIFWIEFRLGFRVEQRINLLFRRVIEDMVANEEVDITSRYASLGGFSVTGDFCFIVLHHYLSLENKLRFFDKIIMNAYFLLKKYSLSEDKAFGLDTSSVIVEPVPLIIEQVKTPQLKRNW